MAETLQDELAWQADGHVSELGLTLLADGQAEHLPPNAALHVDGCVLCTDRMTELVMLSLATEEPVRVWAAAQSMTLAQPIVAQPMTQSLATAPAEGAPVATSQPALATRAPFPFRYFALALGVVLLRFVPGITHLLDAPSSLFDVGRDVLSVVRSVRVLMPLAHGYGSEMVLVVSLLATLLCFAGGLLLARNTAQGSHEGTVL